MLERGFQPRGAHEFQLKANEVCMKMFPKKECHQLIYSSSKLLISSRSYSYFQLIYSAKKSPFTYVTYNPSLVVIDFVVYVLSTISFWLGIAPLTMMLDIRKWFEKRKKRNQTHLENSVRKLRNTELNEIIHQLINDINNLKAKV